MLDQEGAIGGEKMVQDENHYLWIDDSEFNNTTEEMSSYCFFVSLGVL